MLFKKDELKHLGLFYLSFFVYGFTSVVNPFMIIFFRNMGYSFFEISLITVSFSLSMLLFEVPTGAFADVYGRKKSTVLGLFLIAISVFGIGISKSLILFIMFWAIAGFGVTFLSGAFDAWVVDNLKYVKRKDLQQTAFIKIQSVVALGFIFAPLIGTFLVKRFDMVILWFFYGLGTLLSLLVMAFIPEHFKSKKVRVKDIYKETLDNTKKAFKFIKGHKVVLYLVVAVIFTTLFIMSEDAWQPLLVSLSLPVENLGFVFSIMSVVLVFAPFLASLSKKFGFKRFIVVILGLSFLLRFSIFFVNSNSLILACIIFITLMALRSLKNTAEVSYLHDHTPSKIRATVASTQNMLISLTSAVTILIAGIGIDYFGEKIMIGASSFFALFAIAVYLKIKE